MLTPYMYPYVMYKSIVYQTLITPIIKSDIVWIKNQKSSTICIDKKDMNKGPESQHNLLW